uniref:Uncharacterized protein n=1 Tax=Knipowitschia caucasica TaxID=637954 RepID=A0AAV2KWF5_KNICA
MCLAVDWRTPNIFKDFFTAALSLGSAASAEGVWVRLLLTLDRDVLHTANEDWRRALLVISAAPVAVDSETVISSSGCHNTGPGGEASPEPVTRLVSMALLQASPQAHGAYRLFSPPARL